MFVSHGASDTWIARQMARCIGDARAETFVDAYDLHVGDRFESAITDAIEDCDELLALVTRLSAKRAYLLNEVGIAAAFRKRISCVLYDCTFKDLERWGGSGILSNRTATTLNDFDRYVSELATRMR